MNEIKCPNCGTIFQIDESDYASIVKQVRDSEFNKEITLRDKEYQKDKNIKGLYLHGSFGAGKSYLIAALFNELSKLNVKSIIVYYPELLRSLKESFNDDFDDRMYKLKTTELLLIDDIGAESVSPWSRDEILGTILQYRMDAKMPTFFTSNLNKDELISHLAYTKNGVDMVKAKRIIERINQLTTDMELISENRRK